MLESGKSVGDYIGKEDLTEITDDELEAVCKAAVEANPKAAEDYRNGKEKAMNALLGFVMKSTKGKADSEKAKEIIKFVMRNS